MPFCQCVPLSKERYAQLVNDFPVPIPLDQTTHWENLLPTPAPSPADPTARTQRIPRIQRTIDPPAPALYFAIQRDGETVALASFARHEVRGQRYYWAKNGPVWATTPTEEEEFTALNRLRKAIRSLDRKAVFFRALVHFPHKITRPVLQSLAYDHTVALDVRGGTEALLSRMKQRGRRDAELALRAAHNEGLTCEEIRDDRTGHFTELYLRLTSTFTWDGAPLDPLPTYRNLLDNLGEHVHLFVISADDGVPLAWSIVLRHGSYAQYHSSAYSAQAYERQIPELMVIEVANALAEMGVHTLDLMGIGSDLAPTLSDVTPFKTKLSRRVHLVPAARDIPILSAKYRALTWARDTIYATRRFKRGPE